VTCEPSLRWSGVECTHEPVILTVSAKCVGVWTGVGGVRGSRMCYVLFLFLSLLKKQSMSFTYCSYNAQNCAC